MPKSLSEILKKQEEMVTVAKKLEFNEIRLCKSAIPEYLGIYAIGGSEENRDARCLALNYAVSNLTGCQVAVMSNKHDIDGSVFKEKTVSLDEVTTEKFQSVFSCLPEEVMIKLGEGFGYQMQMKLNKAYYDRLTAKPSEIDIKTINDEQQKRLLGKASGNKDPEQEPLRGSAITRQYTSGEDNEISQRVKKKITEIPLDIREYLSNCSEEEFREVLKSLEASRVKPYNKLVL